MLFLSIISGNLALLINGFNFAWPSPSIPMLMQDDSPVLLTMNQAMWLISVFSFGFITGSILSIFIVKIIGRKKTLLLGVIPSIIGYLLTAFATKPWELYLSRFLIGTTSAVFHMTIFTYIGEISPIKIRGKLLTILITASKIGILLMYSISPFLSIKSASLISVAIPLVFLTVTVWLPESPYCLMRCGLHQEAVKALVKLRGKKDVSDEIKIIERTIETESADKANFWNNFLLRSNRKALTIVLTLMLVQQLSGGYLILTNAQIIFDAMDTEFEGKYLTIVFGVVQMICSAMSAMIIDHCGRKVLLLISTLGGAISTSLIGVYFYMITHVDKINHLEWMGLIGTVSYIILYSFGLISIPITIMGEIFSTNVKTICSGFSITCGTLFYICLVECFSLFVENFGMYSIFCVFAACNILGFVYVLLYVPETKGKTLLQIQEILRSNK